MSKKSDSKSMQDTTSTDQTDTSSSKLDVFFSGNPSPENILLKASLLSLFMVVIMLLVTAVGVGIWGLNKASEFFDASGLTFAETKEIVTTGLQTPPKQTDSVTTILLLGLDTLETRPGSPQLSDTMMLVFINYADGTITTLPLPRDIWNQEYQTKINALYHYGQERYPDEPERFPREVISELTGRPIDYTVVLTLEQVGTIIDKLGGITVDIPVGFVDTEFPRPDVDVTVEKDPAVLYQTVSFEAGEQVLSGEQALQYIRSRKSADDEGTDLARGSRQQLVIQAISNKLQSGELFTNPQLAGELTRYYIDTFSESISLAEGISIGAQLLQQPEGIGFVSRSLPILPDDENGVLINPPLSKYGLWVYEVSDVTAFRDFVQSLVE